MLWISHHIIYDKVLFSCVHKPINVKTMLQCLSAFIASKRKLCSPLQVKENLRVFFFCLYIIPVVFCNVWTWKVFSIIEEFVKVVTYLCCNLFIDNSQSCFLYHIRNPITGCGLIQLTSCPKHYLHLDFCFQGNVFITF